MSAKLINVNGANISYVNISGYSKQDKVHCLYYCISSLLFINCIEEDPLKIKKDKCKVLVRNVNVRKLTI